MWTSRAASSGSDRRGLYLALPGDAPATHFLEALGREIGARLEKDRPPGGCADVYVRVEETVGVDGPFLDDLLGALARFGDLPRPEAISFEIPRIHADHPLPAMLRRRGIGRICLARRSGPDRSLLRSSLEGARAAGLAGVAVEQPFCASAGDGGAELEEIAEALRSGADHVSLVEEEESPVQALRWADRYQAARALLESNGLERYEIAHFARPGRRSPHVERIFAFGEVIGLGPGAVSRVGLRRWRNTADNGAYAAALRGGRPTADFHETLTPLDVAVEKLALGIRLAKGVDIERICHELPQSAQASIAAAARALTGAGWLESVGGKVRLAERGILFADKIAAELLP